MAASISFIMLCMAFISTPLLIAIGGTWVIRADEREIDLHSS